MTKTKFKKILVTGGAGLIGSHLCQALLAQGDLIICLDDLSTGSESNVAHLMSHPNFTFIKEDLCNPLKHQVDEIYNLASPASPVHYQRSPIQTLKTNVLGSLNVLELAVKTKAKVLQASTSEVYGDPDEHPQKESYWGKVNPHGIRSCYDEGKRAAETLFFDFHRQHNVDIRVARIFNTYGPHMRSNDGRIISNFIVQALRGEALTIYGNGEHTRSFCYVDDLVRGLITMMNSSIIGPVNLGNPVEISVLDLAQQIIRLTKSPSTVTYQALPEDDPRRRCPDITLAKNHLQWKPEVSLEEGLKRTIFYFQKQVP